MLSVSRALSFENGVVLEVTQTVPKGYKVFTWFENGVVLEVTQTTTFHTVIYTMFENGVVLEVTQTNDDKHGRAGQV